MRDFYREILGKDCPELRFLLDQDGGNIGHFNVFDIGRMYSNCKAKSPGMPYNRRSYYKISLIRGKNRVEYADRVLEIAEHALLFASPRVPYRYTPLNQEQAGHFCVFTTDFLSMSKTGTAVHKLPIFGRDSAFVFELTAGQAGEIEQVFGKMHREIGSDYEFKYDLLRNYVMELIHYGQKLQPAESTKDGSNAAGRIFSLFIELLERQFPVESPSQSLGLKTAGDYAAALKVHVNHLNKVLKESTGKTTTEIIAARVSEEARILLKQTQSNISEIAYSLGFEEVAHFSNFFKRHTGWSPMAYREQLFESHKQ